MELVKGYLTTTIFLVSVTRGDDFSFYALKDAVF